jgi:hypothetical protein
MGMYDTIRFFELPAPACPAGHELRELQTKDLENTLAQYLVHRGRLYRELASDDSETAEADTNDRVVVIRRRQAEPVALTSEAVAYTSCVECRPVLFLREGTLRGRWGDYVQGRSPWCEWRLVFAGGYLERVVPERVETRDDVRRKLLAEGLEVLNDDDRLARLHFRELEAERDVRARADRERG